MCCATRRPRRADDDDKKIDTSIEIDPFSDDGGTIHIKIKHR